MTITLELTDEEKQAIERKAKRLGLTTSEYVRRLAGRAARTTRMASKTQETRPKTPAEYLDELESANFPFSYGDPATDSPELGRQLAARFSHPNRERVQ